MKSHLFFIFLTFLFVVTNLLAQTENSKSEFRRPFTELDGDYLAKWLVVGGIKTESKDPFNTDLLENYGGETVIFPKEGDIVTNPDGSQNEWKNHQSSYNYFSFIDALQGVKFNEASAYAFTQFESKYSGESILSFGIIGDAKIWLNGKLVYNKKNGSGSREENVHLKVNLADGKNKILIKSMDTGWTWGFKLRFINPNNISMLHDFILSPKIIDESISGEKLVIKTDNSLNPELYNIDVTVKVKAAGGEVIAEKVSKRNEEISFNSEEWKNGIYDICFSSKNNEGENVTAYLYWYKGDALKYAKSFIDNLNVSVSDVVSRHYQMLGEMIIDRLDNNFDNPTNEQLNSIYPALLEVEELKLSEKGIESIKRANGYYRLAYIDDVDGSIQFCRVYLPMNYDPNKKYPLVLRLHGYNPANPLYINWWSVSDRHSYIADEYEIIYAEPHGRGNTSYKGIGENDILNCVRNIKENLSVDDSRIYLTGDSMGGGGVWHVGTRHPHIFAAIAPVYGGWDYHVSLTEEKIKKLSPLEIFNRESESSYAQAEALLTTPVFVAHGDIDAAVDVKESRYAVNLLQKWGYNIRYREIPGFAHEGIDFYDDIIEWFLNHKLDKNPKEVRVRAATLKSAQSHWVKVIQKDKPFEFIGVKAKVLDNNTISLTTKNVLEIEISPSSDLINHNKPVNIIWNVDTKIKVDIVDGKILVKSTDYNPAQKIKTPALPGPLSNLTITPFIVVIGTSSDNEHLNSMNKIKAEEFIKDWEDWQKVKPRVVLDTELTEEQIKKYTLILIGANNSNSVTKRFQKEFPLNVNAKEIVVSGKTFSVEDAYVKMIYPNPLNKERYFAVIGASSAAGMHNASFNDNRYDFYILDGCIPNQRKGRSLDKVMIARGTFNYNWQLDEPFIEYGDGNIRKNSPFKIVAEDGTVNITNTKDIEQKVLRRYIGTYQIMPGYNLKVSLKDNLIFTGPQGETFKAYPESENEFFIAEANVQFTFNENSEGKISEVVIHQESGDTIATKMK